VCDFVLPELGKVATYGIYDTVAFRRKHPTLVG